MGYPGTPIGPDRNGRFCIREVELGSDAHGVHFDALPAPWMQKMKATLILLHIKLVIEKHPSK